MIKNYIFIILLSLSLIYGSPINELEIKKCQRLDYQDVWVDVSSETITQFNGILKDLPKFKTWWSTIPDHILATPPPFNIPLKFFTKSNKDKKLYFSSNGKLVQNFEQTILIVPAEHIESLRKILNIWRAKDIEKLTSRPLPLQYEIGSVPDGGTLSGISRLFYGTSSRWSDIYKANKSLIKDPDIILNGTIITIPKLKIK